jgi:hypothetical protein
VVRSGKPSLSEFARIASPFLPESGTAILRTAPTWGRHPSPPAGYSHLESFLVAPPLGRPRALLPDPARGAHRLFLVRPRSAQAGMGQRIAALAFGRAPDRVVEAGSQRLSIFTHQTSPLAERLRARVSGATLGVIVNPSNIDRPAIVAFSRAGKPEVLAKVSVGEADVARQRHEWHVLRSLAALPQLRPTVPTPLEQLRSGGSSALLTDVVVGRPCPGALSPSVARWLSRCVQSDRMSAGTSSLVRRVIQQARLDFGSESAIAKLVCRAGGVLSGVGVARTIVHGDFVPWNITMVGEEPHVFDWEWSALDGLPGWDAAYFEIQSGVILRRWKAEQLLHCVHDAAHRPPHPYTVAEYRALLALILAQVALLGRPDAVHRRCAMDALHDLHAQHWLAQL